MNFNFFLTTELDNYLIWILFVFANICFCGGPWCDRYRQELPAEPIMPSTGGLESDTHGAKICNWNSAMKISVYSKTNKLDFSFWGNIAYLVNASKMYIFPIFRNCVYWKILYKNFGTRNYLVYKQKGAISSIVGRGLSKIQSVLADELDFDIEPTLHDRLNFYQVRF